MFSIIMDLRHALIKDKFFQSCQRYGLTWHQPSPLLTDDKTVYFASATITPLKNMLLDEKIYDGGVYLHQPCLRLQSMTDPFYAGTKIRYPGYFNMLGTLVPANAVVDFQDVIACIIADQGISADKVKVNAAKQDKILIERFRHHYDVEYDTRPEKSYNWTYGMGDNIRGRGITFYLRQDTGEYKRIGQYIAIFNDGRLIGCEYGVGIEVLLARTEQYQNEYDAFAVAPVLKKYGLGANFTHSHVFSTVASAYSTGISLKEYPAIRYKKLLQKMLLNLTFLKMRNNLTDEQIFSILSDYMVVEFNDARNISILMNDFSAEQHRLCQQLANADAFINNQYRLGKDPASIQRRMAELYPLYFMYKDMLSR